MNKIINSLIVVCFSLILVFFAQNNKIVPNEKVYKFEANITITNQIKDISNIANTKVEEVKSKKDETTKKQNTSEKKESNNKKSLGTFKLTAYCPCSKCCGKWASSGTTYGSTGTALVAGVSIAVDPSVIPYYTKVIINGREYIAHDTGGAIKGNRIDVFFNSHQEALNFGVQYADVFICK